MRLCGLREPAEQTWAEYTVSLLVFSAVGCWSPTSSSACRLAAAESAAPRRVSARDLAFNTAASFTTNTNWQSYSGESTMSYLTQMAGLAWHNFISAAAGIGVALAVARGFTRRPGPTGKTLGNFWVDLVRGIVYVLLPLSIVVALVLVSQGVIQNFSALSRRSRRSRARSRRSPMGPVASQEVIKQLGTNGGGFFNANSAHPFENPTPLTEPARDAAHLRDPGGADLHVRPHGARPEAGLGAVRRDEHACSLAGVATCYWAEAHPNAAMHGLARRPAAPGNMEGKEVRFGIPQSALFATVTTDASCGAVNSMHDSFTPLGGLVPLFNILLGEVIFGGVGAGCTASSCSSSSRCSSPA